jgi:hypothetical protein
MGKNVRKAPTNVILAVRGKISARLLFSQHVRIGSRYTKLFVSGFPSSYQKSQSEIRSGNWYSSGFRKLLIGFQKKNCWLGEATSYQKLLMSQKLLSRQYLYLSRLAGNNNDMETRTSWWYRSDMVQWIGSCRAFYICAGAAGHWVRHLLHKLFRAMSFRKVKNPFQRS